MGGKYIFPLDQKVSSIIIYGLIWKQKASK